MMKVLFIDDDHIILTLMTHLLPPDSFQVHTAATVAEAWQLLTHTQPDVICCDLVMPGTNGLDFLAQRQQRPELAHVPIIVLSGTNEQTLLEKAKDLGAAANLTKPFTGKALIALLYAVTQSSLR